MTFFLPLIAIIAGILAASSFLIKKLPDSASLIQKIKPYEGFIGAAALAMGILTLFNINAMMRIGMMYGVISLVCIVSSMVMGFLLGFPVLQDLLLDELSENARKKSDDLYERLMPYKVISGMAAIGTGLYLLFA